MWMLVGANGYTLAGGNDRFEALVIENGVIRAVGARQELELQFSGKISRVLDVGGATVIPGLVDSHLHVIGVGEQAMRLNLTDVTSKDELLEQVRAYASRISPDEWILGNGWNENRFRIKSLPTMEELNQASMGRPMLLTRICHHAYLANQEAFRRAGLDETASDPSDGYYERDAAGRFTGRVYENASIPIKRAVPDFTWNQWKEALSVGMKAALEAGITAVHTDDTRPIQGFADTWKAYTELLDEDRVRLRVHELVDYAYLEECAETLPTLREPDGWLELGAVKLFSDGAFGGRTAWLSEPYSDQPGWSGTPMYSSDVLRERVRRAHDMGRPVAIHAIGDRALDETLAAMECAPLISQRDRVVHAELIRPDLVRRMQALGSRIIVDAQPRFTCSDFPWVRDRVGDERAKNICAWRTMMDAGLYLCGGSDAPIEPISPLLGIHAAVTRRLPHATGEGYVMEQALSVREALYLFTRGACFANGSEDKKGVIAPGWMADLTILDRDILSSQDPDDIRDAKVLFTVVGGHVAYAAQSLSSSWTE